MAEQTSSSNQDGAPDVVCSLETFKAQKYDYIIVGGGTAGLAVAARLTENPHVTVGVLEAGADHRGEMLVDIPGFFLQMLNHPDYDWQYKTVPQEGAGGIPHHIPRGKALGGSSAINYMMYVRGSDQDYDDWAALTGDDSWSAENFKHYMRKHQTLEPIDESVTNRSTMPFVGENHGTSGPVRTSFNDYLLPIEDDVIKACDEVAGLTKKPTDPWSGDHIGFYNTLGSVVRTGPDKGKRSYAARGYLGMSQGRPNLKVLCEALVIRVDLEGTTAKGVTFSHKGAQHSVPVNREVILCGGAINSPQILELSGIGDPEVLSAAGVQCKVELPSVGNNFQDHTVSAVGYELAPGNLSNDAIWIPEVMTAAQKALAETHGGPLTAISSCQGFFPFKQFATEEELEEVVASIRETANTSSPFQKKQLEQVIAQLQNPKSANLQFVLLGAKGNFEKGVMDQSKLFAQTDGKKMHVSLVVCLQYPASRGSVHITSSDPTAQPAIDPGYNRHPADVAVLATGLRFIDKVTKAKALEGKLTRRYFPESENLDLQNAKDARQAVRNMTLGEYHACGSCAMGDTVDSRLRVKGVQGLRVADASVFPNNVSGNICATVYAIAEKAADMIRDDWDYAPLNKLQALAN
ncbi:hypothetical protein VTO42DRAFT_558 [Malbranchea cinnamomea]